MLHKRCMVFNDGKLVAALFPSECQIANPSSVKRVGKQSSAFIFLHLLKSMLRLYDTALII